MGGVLDLNEITVIPHQHFLVKKHTIHHVTFSYIIQPDKT